MKRCAAAFLVTVGLHGMGLALSTPQDSLTPGQANSFLTKEIICSEYFHTGDFRNVSQIKRKFVMQTYGLDWETHRDYEIDHLVPLELGGSNSIVNLWPQPWPEAKVKDRLENSLHDQVCAGTKTLEHAQEEIRRWYVTSPTLK